MQSWFRGIWLLDRRLGGAPPIALEFQTWKRTRIGYNLIRTDCPAQWEGKIRYCFSITQFRERSPIRPNESVMIGNRPRLKSLIVVVEFHRLDFKIVLSEFEPTDRNAYARRHSIGDGIWCKHLPFSIENPFQSEPGSATLEPMLIRRPDSSC